jgi:hypothetical protein
MPVLFLFLLCAYLSCDTTPPQETAMGPRFVDVAAEVGLDFEYTNGAVGDYFLIETMGAGAAFLDYDQNGWLDIYLVDGFDLAHLRGTYPPVNLSYSDETHYWVQKDYQPKLRFEGLVEPSAHRVAPTTQATRNRLYHNRGDGTFRAVANAAGADDPGYGMGVATGYIGLGIDGRIGKERALVDLEDIGQPEDEGQGEK